jgi:hypothetical protein
VYTKLWRRIGGVVVVGIALVAGLAAAGIMNAPAIPPAPSGTPPAGATSVPSAIDAGSPRPSAGESPTTGDVAVLVGAGDIADCERHEDSLTADLLETIPGTVFTLGDNAYPDGSISDFEKCYGPAWGRQGIKERTRPAVGDNEYDTPGAAGYFTYFGDAAGDPATGYYAYDAESWRVYVLNSECGSVGGCGEGSAQEAWLLQDLAAEPRDCVLAMWHDPYFSSGPSGGGSSATRNLWRVLSEAGAELVLSGHDHIYERFDAQTGDGHADPERGMVQFVVGTGGGDPDRIQTVAPNSLVRKRGVYGVLRLELGPGAYDFEFISVAGPQFTDRGSGECH